MPDTPRPTSPQGKRRVAVFSTGGTIAMQSVPGKAGAMLQSGGDLLAPFRSHHPDVVLTHSELFAKPSASVTLEDVQRLADGVQDVLERGYCGAVVTHGTDTLEETAFSLSLLLDTQCPVVLTGAMRRADQAGADGPANLEAAIVVAASSQAQGLGPVVLFGDEIHAPHLVRKIHTSRPQAFSSAPLGPIGQMVEGQLSIAMTTLTWRSKLRLKGAVPAVPIIQAGLDLEPETIAAFAGAPIGALIIAGAGGGHVSARAVPAIADLAAAMPVIITSKTGMGHTLTRSYGYGGSEIDLARCGVLNGGRWRPAQARILAQIILSGRASERGQAIAELADWLAR